MATADRHLTRLTAALAAGLLTAGLATSCGGGRARTAASVRSATTTSTTVVTTPDTVGIGPGDTVAPAPTTTVAPDTTTVPVTTPATTPVPSTTAVAVATSVAVPVPTSAAVSPDAALASILASLQPHAAASPVVSSSAGIFAAIAYARPPASGPTAATPTLVNVYKWSGSAWVAQTTHAGTGALLDPLVGFAVSSANLTNAGQPDFVITGSAGASATGLFVVALLAGSWQAVPVQHPSGGVVFVDSRVSGQTVQESADDCNPDCADGKVTTTTYQYSATSAAFVPVGTTTTGGTG